MRGYWLWVAVGAICMMGLETVTRMGCSVPWVSACIFGVMWACITAGEHLERSRHVRK
jgi:hypothetical protein